MERIDSSQTNPIHPLKTNSTNYYLNIQFLYLLSSFVTIMSILYNKHSRVKLVDLINPLF